MATIFRSLKTRNHHQTWYCIVLVAGLVVGTQVLGAQEADLVLRVDDPSVILRMENAMRTTGFRGRPQITLADTEYSPSDATEALIHFNARVEGTGSPYMTVVTRDYSVQSTVKQRGDGAGRFDASNRGLVLGIQGNSIFAPGTQPGSFTIEFWAMATSYTDGQSFISWNGNAWLGQDLVPQAMGASIRNRKVRWTFDNFFLDATSGQSGARVAGLNIALENKRELIPGQWYHHMVRHDASRGIIEYLLNGVSEDVRYLTQSGRSGGQTYQAYIGERSPAELTIGRRLTGFIDELRISRTWIQEPAIDVRARSGYVIFNPINFLDIGAGSKVLNLRSTIDATGTSTVQFYWFMIPAAPGTGINALLPPAFIERDDPRWKPLVLGQALTGQTSGIYLMLKAELLPDGSGSGKPGFQDLTIVYTPDPPPPAPGGLELIPGDRSLEVRWNAVPSPDIAGYMIYYGTRPGQYFGVEALEGPSPLDVGDPRAMGNTRSFTLRGLENYRSYYVVVASYDRSNDPKLGLHIRRSLTREVSARPAP